MMDDDREGKTGKTGVKTGNLSVRTVNNGPPEKTGQKKLAQKLATDRTGLSHIFLFISHSHSNPSPIALHKLRSLYPAED